MRAGLAAVALCVAAALAPAPASAIVGGGPAQADTFGSLAFISDNLSDGQNASCTGTVVASNVVMTAAHCLTDGTGMLEPVSGFSVDTGTLDPTDDPAAQSTVSAALLDPSFEPSTDAGDVGLLLLSTATSAPPVTLADAADAAELANQVPIMIAGWGLTNPSDTTQPAVLQWADMTTAVAPWCAQNTDLNFNENTEICALGDASSVAVCNGDSGGPAFATGAAGTQVELGIINRGADRDPSKPSVFMRVDQVAAWVQSQIAANPPGGPVAAPAAPVVVQGSSTPMPAVSVAPPAASSPPPRSGLYAGRSAQRHGQLRMTVSEGALTRLRVAFNLRCAGVWRGPITTTRAWHASPLELVAAKDAWTFATRYSAGGYAYAISGTLLANGTASGTLLVSTHHPSCSSGAISWRASLPAG